MTEQTFPRQPYIGGQAVIEGVMMRSPKSFVVAVRRHVGGIAIREQKWEQLLPSLKFLRWPIFRGALVLAESLHNGFSALKFSSEHGLPPEEQGKKSNPSVSALLAFVLSATLAALAGSTKTVVLGFETLTDVHWTMSGMVILMTLVGGLGTMLGPVVGAVVIIVLENKLGDIGDWLATATGVAWFQTLGESVTIVIGAIFIICVLSFRRGLVGELVARSRFFRTLSQSS